MPNIVKIGLTSGLPEDRAKELYTTGVPTPFNVVYRTTTSRPEAVERKAHDLLNKQRVNSKREFFRVSVDEAINTVRQALVDTASINSWQHTKPYLLVSGDRISLTLKSGQMFALISYSNFAELVSGHASVIDLWQAHSDGDLLEIYVTESASHISSFSHSGSGSDIDPVPYLDREENVVNGLINGRERLMPGERLIWIPGPEDEEDEASVIFQAKDHSQIVSRTWTPKLGLHGLPLALNDFTHRKTWPVAERSIRAALALSIPNSWSPRENREPSWVPIGTELPEPEYWLPQLKRPQRKR
jgi:hypothetical protein